MLPQFDKQTIYQVKASRTPSAECQMWAFPVFLSEKLHTLASSDWLESESFTGIAQNIQQRPCAQPVQVEFDKEQYWMLKQDWMQHEKSLGL